MPNKPEGPFDFEIFPAVIETEEKEIDLTDLSDEELDDFINGNL